MECGDEPNGPLYNGILDYLISTTIVMWERFIFLVAIKISERCCFCFCCWCCWYCHAHWSFVLTGYCMESLSGGIVAGWRDPGVCDAFILVETCPAAVVTAEWVIIISRRELATSRVMTELNKKWARGSDDKAESNARMMAWLILSTLQCSYIVNVHFHSQVDTYSLRVINSKYSW